MMRMKRIDIAALERAADGLLKSPDLAGFEQRESGLRLNDQIGGEQQ